MSRYGSFCAFGCVLMAALIGCSPQEPVCDEEARAQLRQLDVRMARLETEFERLSKKLERLSGELAAAKATPPREESNKSKVEPSPPAKTALAREEPTKPKVEPPSSPPSAKSAPAQPSEQAEKSAPVQFDEFTLKVQRALKRAGFDPGPVDGKKGPMTTKALQAFQQDNNLPQTGMADEATWALLKRYLEK